MRSTDICIIGGGASGMMSAIIAARNGSRVTIIEHMDRVGKKILSTGNGRCNYTNTNQALSNYRCANEEFVSLVLQQFGYNETIKFFSEFGIIPKDRNGYIYPNSNQASSILDVLRFEMEKLKVNVLTQTNVIQINEKKNGFEIRTDGEDFLAKRLILATGSKAAKVTGSDGSGYDFAKYFGHSIKPVVPALVQLKSDMKCFKAMSGVRTDGKIDLYVNDNLVSSDTGELQLTDYGISGIPVFQVSRFAALGIYEKRNVYAKVNFLPQFQIEEVKSIIENRRVTSKNEVCDALTGMLNKKLITVLVKEAGISVNKRINELSDTEIESLTKKICEFKINIISTNSFDNAQVCAGGVDTNDINPKTMESKIVPGLFFAGEIVDVDGACGGYNLQWAWSSGYVAGIGASKSIK